MPEAHTLQMHICWKYCVWILESSGHLPYWISWNIFRWQNIWWRSYNKNFMDNSWYSDSIIDHQIATNFCTCRKYTAVMLCANITRIHLIKILVWAKRNYYLIWIVMQKLLSKWTPVASFTKEVNLRLPKRPLKTSWHLANRGLTSFVKEATGVLVWITFGHG